MFFERRVQATVRDVAEPAPHFTVCQSDIDEFWTAGLQRIEERFAQVTVKPLDLAFGLRAIRRAELDLHAVVLGEVQQRGVVAVQALAVRVPLDDDRLGVVGQDMRRNATEELERAF